MKDITNQLEKSKSGRKIQQTKTDFHLFLCSGEHFFGTISNILNEDYEETLGYSTRGRNYKLGIRLQF